MEILGCRKEGKNRKEKSKNTRKLQIVDYPIKDGTGALQIRQEREGKNVGAISCGCPARWMMEG